MTSNLTPSGVLVRLMAVFLLIVINAFFVAAEFSIVSVRRSRINQLASAGDIQAKTVQSLQRSIDRLLSATQLGITLSSLALGWISEGTMAVLIAALLTHLPIPTPIVSTVAHSIALPLAFIVVAYLQIVLGELCPKSVALLYPEQLSRVLGAPSLAIARIFNPFIWVLNQSTHWLLRLVGIEYTGQGWANRVTPEELQLIISTSTESPDLEAEERQILSNVFEFREVSAGEVMVPRTSIVSLSRDATFQMLLDEVVDSGHSRYPVIGESLDDVCGVIYFKELAEPMAKGLLAPDSPVEPWIRPARFVPEYLPLNELLQIMQRSGQPMVMVVDQFGGTAGLVTIQDLTAEILGDSHEPEDDSDTELQILDEQTFLVQAQMNLEELNDLLDLDLPITEDYQTLGGFVIYEMQKIPEQGEKFQYRNLEFTLVSADGPRLQHIQIQRSDALNTSDSLSDFLVADVPLSSDSPSATESNNVLDTEGSPDNDGAGSSRAPWGE